MARDKDRETDRADGKTTRRESVIFPDKCRQTERGR